MHKLFKLIQLCCTKSEDESDNSNTQPKHISHSSLDVTMNITEKPDISPIEKIDISRDESALTPINVAVPVLKKKRRKKPSKQRDNKKSGTPSDFSVPTTPINGFAEESKVPIVPEKKPLKGILKKPKM